MGYRYNCVGCDFWSCVKKANEEHIKETGHTMWGGALHYKAVSGLEFQWERGVVSDEDKALYKEYIKEIDVLVKHKHHNHLYLSTPNGWIMYKESQWIYPNIHIGYERPELGELIDNRKPKPRSKKRGCPKCNKSENIRYVSKGTLICKACDYTFGKGEKL